MFAIIKRHWQYSQSKHNLNGDDYDEMTVHKDASEVNVDSNLDMDIIITKDSRYRQDNNTSFTGMFWGQKISVTSCQKEKVLLMTCRSIIMIWLTMLLLMAMMIVMVVLYVFL